MEDVARDPQLLKGVLGMLVLRVLSDEDTYGYELVTRLTSRGLPGISTGTVYPVLNRLERDGLLASRLVASSAGPARKYYGVTARGGKALVEAISGWNELSAAVGSVLGSAATSQTGTDPEPGIPTLTSTKGKTA